MKISVDNKLLLAHRMVLLITKIWSWIENNF